MAPAFNHIARSLMQSVLADHPDWQPHVFARGPEDDPQAEEGSVVFRIPAPLEPAHRLEITQRGNTIEIAYDCESPCVRAEVQFVWRDDYEIADAMQGMRAFLSDLSAGRVVIVRETLGKIVRFVRRDGVGRRGGWSDVLRSAAPTHEIVIRLNDCDSPPVTPPSGVDKWFGSGGHGA